MTRRPVAAPPFAAMERDTLLAFLQRQRDFVAWKVGGLSDLAARGVTTPTGLTVPGVVRHLEAVERGWVRKWFAGQPGLLDWTDDTGADGPLDELLGDYAAETRRCDEVIAAHSLDDLEVTGGRSLRWILHHLVEETARHLGHLDLLCEIADGRIGEGP